jgi:tetratricopeptide (TPR) repeat protein
VRVALVIAALTWSSLTSLWRESNSHAESARGGAAFEKKQYPAAAQSYDRAQKLAPSPRASFNLGTAEIAAGKNEQGSELLAPAIKDPSLRADAFFNRGNAAMAAKAWDRAIRDYENALRAQPSHASAKRNLEIALNKQEQSNRSSGGGQNQQQGKNNQQPKDKQAPQQGNKPQPGQPDMQALLRSVQQQEQEEMRRMKGLKGQVRVGW